ncbi:MAG: SDR family NAD(P)-dependent oxidoreductase [Nitrososphaerota archaeon]|jgi:NAD(P)-dependent dehydrogenase (short-subunit alcohol dehydrogenase family)|nr:SDR family NAD(P)-dependent oxidoreductase [Nitrososphaerota archaeon]MDG6954631.1 SDR family NAD(P)-dependent oxidoreductase [Nitrososphaerota archaeon]
MNADPAKIDPQGAVLVSGASSGMGNAVASYLSRLAYQVTGTSRRPPASPSPFEMLQLDVDSEESVAECVAKVVKLKGRLDVLVNNAGSGLFGAIEETSTEQAKALSRRIQEASSRVPSVSSRRWNGS